jgi:hypothetical protein
MPKMLFWIMSVGAAVVLHAQSAKKASTPTFARDVAPILQRNCQTCHRPGQAAPFSLLTYEQARPWAKSIKEAVLQRKMPPWFADPQFGKFANNPSLTREDIDTLSGWVDGGAPMGDPKEMPAPKNFVEGWSIPKPDIVFQLPKPFQVPATGILEYKYVIIPTGFTQDTWVEQVQAAPTEYSVVHHIVAYVRTPGSNYFKDMPKNEFFEAPPSKSDAPKPPKDDVPSDWLTGYAPGQPPDVFKPGQAKLIPAGSDIVLEIHYMPEGKAASDQSRLGLVLAKQPPTERTYDTLGWQYELQDSAGPLELPSRLVVYDARGRNAPRIAPAHAHARQVGRVPDRLRGRTHRDPVESASVSVGIGSSGTIWPSRSSSPREPSWNAPNTSITRRTIPRIRIRQRR